MADFEPGDFVLVTGDRASCFDDYECKVVKISGESCLVEARYAQLPPDDVSAGHYWLRQDILSNLSR